ncbi:MAG: hypothetical protein MI867_24355 [Pseudomonadales bacterium]|nr:hypothetical protein [Pseudomonadales bacterium]
MALLWYKQEGETTYEVRQAGQSVRLYTNGVLHSQYNPDRAVTSSVWDLLTLPAFFLPASQIRRVLLLGVGGGAVLQQLRRWVNPSLMVGVELNGMHLKVARDFFALDSQQIVLYQDDAVAWLERYQGPPFDMIIDDLYGHDNGEPVRAVPLETSWCELLESHLSDDGVLVTNTVAWKELKESAFCVQQKLTERFAKAFRFVTPTCDNAVGAFFRQPVKKSVFKKQLQAIPELAKADQSGLLRYQIRVLF